MKCKVIHVLVFIILVISSINGMSITSLVQGNSSNVCGFLTKRSKLKSVGIFKIGVDIYIIHIIIILVSVTDT